MVRFIQIIVVKKFQSTSKYFKHFGPATSGLVEYTVRPQPQKRTGGRGPNGKIYSNHCCLRDWSRSAGSYGNNTRVICCPAPGRPESAARGTSPPDKSRGCCCRNSRPTVINPDYNMTKQRCMKVNTTKYVQNHHQIERRRLLASIVTSRISP